MFIKNFISVKKKIYFSVALSLAALTASSATGLTPLSGNPNAVSPDGRYVVGSEGMYGSGQMKSFIYDVTTGEIEWKTMCEDEYGAVAPESTGRFMSVTNSGIIAGTMKNKDMVIVQSVGGGFAPPRYYAESEEDEIRMPMNSAAVWRDGKVYTLGTADMTLDKFLDSSGDDGSLGVAVSADGSKVIGYLCYQWFPVCPVLWSYNAATDSYDYKRLSLGDAAQGQPTAMSSDGSIVVGQVSMGDYGAKINQYPAVWVTGDEEPVLLNLGFNAKAVAISPNGRYILVQSDDYSRAYLGVYDMQIQDMRRFNIPNDVSSCQGYAVSDNGDAWIGLYNNNSYTNELYYYNVEDELLLSANEYLGAYGMALDMSISSLTVASTSADGKVIILKDPYGNGSYVLKLPDGNPKIVGKPECMLYFSGLGKATLAWNRSVELPEGVRIVKYDVSVDGNLIKSFTEEDSAENPNGFDFSYSWDASFGKVVKATVEPVAEDTEGKAVISVPATMSATMPEDVELVHFMNFDDAAVGTDGNVSLTQDTWNARTYEGTSLMSWHLEASDFNNSTPYFSTIILDKSTYSSALESRFFDATDADDFYFTLFYQMREVNDKNQNRAEEYLDIEYTTDGYGWNLLKRINAADILPGVWNFEIVDLGELAGKGFRLRLNANGNGKAFLKWYADNLGIIDSFDGASPNGLRAVDSAESVKLTWQNSLGQYEVSHMGNYNFYTDYNLGNEGQPLMVAVDFSPEKLAEYVGGYITSVNAFVFDDPSLMTESTKADAVVFADGVEVARAAYDGAFDSPAASTIVFKTPVKIEGGKTYRIAVDLTYYDATQSPIYYTADKDACIPGVTDLYSEDGGVTWNKVSETLYNEDNPLPSYCVLPIRANISLTTDVPEVFALDNNLLGYDVFRNGEKINTSACYAISPLFIDLDPEESATYTVRAFYINGLVSPLSEPLEVKHSGIDSAYSDSDLSVSRRQGAIVLGGDFDNAELYRLDGVLAAVFPQNGCLSTIGLQQGIYILRVQTGKTSKTMKLVVTE